MAVAGTFPELHPVQCATLAALPEPALITRDEWEREGFEILCANPAFCHLTGYAAGELTGQNTRLFHGAKTDLPPLVHLRPAHQRNGEGWLSRKDGGAFFARWNFNPLTGPDTAPGLLVAVFQDQSETRRLRDALLQSRKLDTIGRLASGVAHDFNIMLSIINGYCEIMGPKIAGVPAAKKDLDEIHRAGLKASAIARQILEFSQRRESEVRVVNYNTLIREIAGILRRVAGEHVDLELRLTSGLGNARIDPTQFQQVLLNLCFNAREAMPRGGKLTIRTYNHKAEPGGATPGMTGGFYSTVQVSDTGHGIEPDLLAHVFEPFFTTKPTGTGLGLATVLGIVRQHDGHVTVRSTVGKGTVFEVFLPETPEQEQTAPPRSRSHPPTRVSESLLLVEPDAVLRKMIGGMLVTEGYQVTAAGSVGAARTAMVKPKSGPQLVLAHCHKKTVAALVRQLHARNPALRLVNLSVDATPVPPGFAPGAVVHLPRPFALSDLLAHVRTLLDAAAR